KTQVQLSRRLPIHGSDPEAPDRDQSLAARRTYNIRHPPNALAPAAIARIFRAILVAKFRPRASVLEHQDRNVVGSGHTSDPPHIFGIWALSLQIAISPSRTYWQAITLTATGRSHFKTRTGAGRGRLRPSWLVLTCPGVSLFRHLFA